MTQFLMLQGVPPLALHQEQTMVKNGRNHDKRQSLLSTLKRSLRKGWVFKILIAVIWKIVDRITD